MTGSTTGQPTYRAVVTAEFRVALPMNGDDWETLLGQIREWAATSAPADYTMMLEPDPDSGGMRVVIALENECSTTRPRLNAPPGYVGGPTPHPPGVRG